MTTSPLIGHVQRQTKPSFRMEARWEFLRGMTQTFLRILSTHKALLVAGSFFVLCYFFVCDGAVFGAAGKDSEEFQKFTSDLRRRFDSCGWTDLDVGGIDWEYHRKSQGNRPLVFATFGNNPGRIVLFLAGVHGDENPPVYILFRLAQFLQTNPAAHRDNTIVVAPLVNPDGFFSKPQKRTNGAGVDVNRNFPTKDWKKSRKNRYYSGPYAASENETKFQIALINRFKPTHIVSIHSPLGCYDYDGPSSDLDSIVIWMKKVSRRNGLPFRRYQVFPGSLGNYAGMERKVHTLTLELPSSAPQKGAEYFDQFRNMFLDILEIHPEIP